MKDIMCVSLARNCEEKLESNFYKLDKQLDDLSRAYFIYENNSSDNTRDILKELGNKNNNVFYICDDLDNIKSFDRFNATYERVEYMCKLRNIYIEIVEEVFNDYKYLLVIDLDLYDFDLSCIPEIIKNEEDFDMYGSYGVISKTYNRYYDTWALHPNNITINKDGLTKVESCFGGAGLYKMVSISGCKYEFIYPSGSMRSFSPDADHNNLHRQMREKGKNLIFINPKMKTWWREK